ncbi:cupin domain-containing protein [Halodesulfovibrio marinisediminis]|uniref:Ethanolamine utilization protein EutQ n=1 Tax=Halodesulfovibrio marinisediminis DSM 17456 TaxID=1121457 RepID=A0A1N6GYM8_9BACT|nr:cupin domain-containing protein [Halodesulfovibrio marinisediminis]SIO12557.1 ethanolamine utilization protein EutQ [Halodesulfovibrio marinisediminis DSM 17456]
MKKVVCAKDVETLIEQGKKTLYVDSNTILTPSAKDAAKLAEIEIFEGAPRQSACESVSAPVSCEGAISSDLIYSALKAMYERGMLDTFLKELTRKGLCSEAVGGGKIVRGKSVEMEPFDTGASGAKACSREVIGEGDGRIHSGFFEIDHSRFEQDFACEANCHLLEGTLNLTINGQTVAVETGDVFYIPAGSKVVWDAAGKARLFYSRFPQSKG